MEAERVVRIEGTVLPMRGEDIDTDRIMPARFLRAVTFEGLEQHLFEDERAGSTGGDRAQSQHPFDNPQYAGATILLVNRNFGCGSSREHAPQALRRSGIRAVVGESFSEIFFGNALMIGLPCVTVSANEMQMLMARAEAEPASVMRIDLPAGTCEFEDVRCVIGLPANARDALVTGAWDTTGLLLARYDEVNAVAAKLPYAAGF